MKITLSHVVRGFLLTFLPSKFEMQLSLRNLNCSIVWMRQRISIKGFVHATVRLSDLLSNRSSIRHQSHEIGQSQREARKRYQSRPLPIRCLFGIKFTISLWFGTEKNSHLIIYFPMDSGPNERASE